ncbi:MAG: hypothetical protein CR982_09950 [Candidatus Cloacimonadota bacterium]|nr:MAG: hypothetical protein CR982_09950 [Candidatus Cloacimonadota bacterium]PIE78423.1 MAG: hypothetical protein CSA15_07885 [Candidatus Delongbacteria bacterium]
MKKIIFLFLVVLFISCVDYPYESKSPTLTKGFKEINKSEDFLTFGLDLSEHFAYHRELKYAVSSKVAPSSVAHIIDDSLYISSIPNKAGKNIFKLRAFSSNGAEIQSNLIVNVSQVNDKPTLFEIPSQTVTEGEEFEPINLDDFVNDVDDVDSLLTWSVTGNTELLPNIENRVLTVSQLPNWVGSETLNIKVTDNTGEFSEQEVTFTVKGTDFPTNLTVTPEASTLNIVEGDDILFKVVASDLNITGDEEFSYLYKVDGDSVSNDFVYLFSTDEEMAGVYVVSVDVTDNFDSRSSKHHSWSVIVENKNQGPTMTTNLPSLNLTENFEQSTLNLDEYFSDIDGDLITYSVNFNENEINAEIGGSVLILNSVEGWSGETYLTINATDGLNPGVSEEMLVSVSPMNQAPVISGLPSELFMNEDEIKIFNFSNYIIDDNVSTISIENINNVSQEVSGMNIELTPDQDYNGSQIVTLKVIDGEFIVTENFTLTVNPINDPPVVQDISSISFLMNEDEEKIFDFSPYITDVDGTIPTISIENLNHVTQSVEGWNITLIPDLNYNGSQSVILKVVDGSFVINKQFVLTVQSVNDAPVITGQNPLSTSEETSLTIELDNLIVTDIDNSYPNGFVLIASDGANYTRVGNTITPVENFNGELTVPVVVNDGEFNSNSYNLTVEVTPINDAPIIIGQIELSTSEDTPFEIELTHLIVTDVDNSYPNDFTLTVYGSDGVNYTLDNNIITPFPNYNGTLEVPVIVNDGNSDSNIFYLTVVVTPVNDAPEITGQFAISMAQNTSLTIELSNLIVEDVDNDFPNDFTLILEGGANYYVNQTTITPVENYTGILTIPAKVYDGSDYSDTFDLLVDVTP